MHYLKVYNLSKIEAKSYEVVNKIDDEKIVKFLNNLHPFIGFLWIWVYYLIIAPVVVTVGELWLNFDDSDMVWE